MLRLNLTGSCMPPYPFTFFFLFQLSCRYHINWVNHQSQVVRRPVFPRMSALIPFPPTPAPPPPTSTHPICHNRDLSNHDGNSSENVILKASSRCIKLYYSSVPFDSICLMLGNSSGVDSTTVSKFRKKKKENCCLAFTSTIKRETGKFHVVVEQRRQRNVQKSVMHVQFF